MSDFKTDRITLDRETNEHTRRLKRSLNKVKWSHALMQIFWTAGPVTTIGLIGGYYIGYGTMPSIELLLYFVSFTVFSGIIGLIAKVVYDGTRGHLEEQGERDVLNVTDKLGNLILVARDMIVQGHDDNERRRVAALQLLRRVDLTPFGVTVAFTDLTDSKEIGNIMGQIYTYRRIGLQSRVRDLYSDYRHQIDELVEQLEHLSPESAQELKDWFTGNTSGSLKYGVSREPMFLQRVMSAIDNSNPYIMTFRDVEEIMILAFELINGREIPTLIFSYTGKWKLARALDELERKRSAYRVARAKGGNRIMALASYLEEMGFVTTGEIPDGMEINELIDKVTLTVDNLSDTIQNCLSDPDISTRRLQKMVDAMDTSIELYQMAHEGYKETGKRHNQLIETSKKWQEITERVKGGTGNIQLGPGRKDIRILENVISLDEEARLKVCRHLAWYFGKEDFKARNFSFFSSFNNNRDATAARRLAIEIAVALEPHINLSKPEIQRNINATKAIYLGELSPDMSAEQKAQLGRRMAAEVEDELGTAAEKLAQTLVHQYRVKLTDEAKEFLNHTYGSDLQTLEKLEIPQDELNENFKNRLSQPPHVPAAKPRWVKTTLIAKKYLSNSR